MCGGGGGLGHLSERHSRGRYFLRKISSCAYKPNLLCKVIERLCLGIRYLAEKFSVSNRPLHHRIKCCLNSRFLTESAS